MISQIHIRNFTIVTELTLELAPGMTALTGETGAGKSILLDALSLVLGGRAETSLIRHGKDRAEISVVFNAEHLPEVKQWLIDYELVDEDEKNTCLIRRVINKNGPSKSFINGRPSSIQSLKDLGNLLVDIHGQHAHQSLLKRDLQRQLLDDYGHHEKMLSTLKQYYSEIKALQKQQAVLQQHKNDREARIELLQYQVQELAELDLQANEVADLDTEQRKLSSITEIKQIGEKSIYQLMDADEGSILAQFSSMLKTLEALAELDPKLAAVGQQLSEAHIQAQDAAHELRHYLDHLNLDQEKLQWIDTRLATILDLSRKHRVKAEELAELRITLSTELDTLNQSSEEESHLDSQIIEASKVYQETASKLSKKRMTAAKTLQTAVTQHLQTLGMKQSRFAVQFSPTDNITVTGMERLEFVVSTNPGQPLAPLNKIASGGELSRISLAIQVISANTGRIPTLIFDEVDVGIGGGTAEVVGRLMRNLSNDRQVLCVTHQPQVASLAHNHLQVSKASQGKSTTTQVSILSQQERTSEIARMLGGIDITEQTRSHAEEMLEKSSLV